MRRWGAVRGQRSVVAESAWFSEDDVQRRRDADAWLQANASSLPTDVAAGLVCSLKICTEIEELKRNRRGIFRQLMRAMRITASSERHADDQSGVALSKEAPKGSTRRCANETQRLALKITDGKRLEDWHRNCANNTASKVVRWETKLARLKETAAANGDIEDATNNVDGAVMTPQKQEQAEAARKAELRRQSEDWERRSDLGNGQDPRFAPLPEALMEGMSASLSYRDVTCSIDEEDLPRGSTVVDKMVDLRHRIDFSLNVTVLDIEVEKATVATPAGNTLISASLDEIGPPKMAVTWKFLRAC